MFIIITGAIGIGKTTVCQKLIKIARSQGHSCGGIITYKTPDKGIAVEDVQTGRTEVLASVDKIYRGPSTRKYCFNPEGIDFGLEAIDRGTSSDVLIVDEIGHLELRGEGFVKALEIIEKGKIRNCVMVIRTELLSAFLPQFNIEPVICETNADNRNSLPAEIGSMVDKAITEEAEETS